MHYENPQVPHEVNVSRESELGSFFKLIATFGAILTAAFVVIYLAVKFFAPFIPYSVETALTENFSSVLQEELNSMERKAVYELRQLASNLAKSMNAPPDMPLHVNIIKSGEQNAFASLGGYVFVTSGLLNAVESENGLAMVLAHEIAHVKNRDPIISAAGSATFSFMTAVVFGSDMSFFENTVIAATHSSFSKSQEAKADKDALLALKNYYGHTFGAEEFFVKSIKNDKFALKFLSSHPQIKERIEAILYTQKSDLQKELKPLSKAILNIKNIQE
ncbi:MAG: M48 family metallopeptidase [Campylobacteraceae bacterium]|jgi:Zn-dependent protease with chaperone function|nr:M48 family metallopeptidase [Campylobacteraceae bacterium]